MNTFFSADYIVPVTGEAVKNGVVEVTENGVIVELYAPDNPALSGKKIVRHKGIIVPGFVNAHCHLELSNMIGAIPRRTGLVPFLEQVISGRAADSSRLNSSHVKISYAVFCLKKKNK